MEWNGIIINFNNIRSLLSQVRCFPKRPHSDSIHCMSTSLTLLVKMFHNCRQVSISADLGDSEEKIARRAALESERTTTLQKCREWQWNWDKTMHTAIISASNAVPELSTGLQVQNQKSLQRRWHLSWHYHFSIWNVFKADDVDSFDCQYIKLIRNAIIMQF